MCCKFKGKDLEQVSRVYSVYLQEGKAEQKH